MRKFIVVYQSRLNGVQIWEPEHQYTEVSERGDISSDLPPYVLDNIVDTLNEADRVADVISGFIAETYIKGNGFRLDCSIREVAIQIKRIMKEEYGEDISVEVDEDSISS